MNIRGSRLLALVTIIYALVILGILVSAPRGYQSQTVEELKLEAGEAERIVVLFTSPTCPLCTMIESYWGDVAGLLEDEAATIKIHLDSPQAFRIASAYYIKSTPTILILDKELRELARLEAETLAGVESASKLAEMIKRASREGDPEIPSSLSITLYPLLGAAIALSPCSAPLLALYATASATTRPGVLASIRCSLLAIAGVGLAGVLALLSVKLLLGLIEATPIALGSLLVALGFLALAGEGESWLASRLQFRSLDVACLGFGMLASQCSLPLVAGAILSLASAKSLTLSVASLVLLLGGFGVVLALVVYTSGRIASFIYKHIKPESFIKLSGAIVIALGLLTIIAWW